MLHWLRRNPRLLLMSASTLANNISGILAALTPGVMLPQAAAELLSKCPSLVARTPASILVCRGVCVGGGGVGGGVGVREGEEGGLPVGLRGKGFGEGEHSLECVCGGGGMRMCVSLFECPALVARTPAFIQVWKGFGGDGAGGVSFLL